MKRVIETFTGRMVDPFDISLDDICIEDIAHALAFKCRFTGHSRQFVSIAEHSVNVSRLCEEMNYGQFSKAGLLHDASEAYLPDVASPLKQDKIFYQFRVEEFSLQSKIYSKFGCNYNNFSGHEVIKACDTAMLAVEAEKNMRSYYFERNWEWLRQFSYEHSVMMGKARKFSIGRFPSEAESCFLKCWKNIK